MHFLKKCNDNVITIRIFCQTVSFQNQNKYFYVTIQSFIIMSSCIGNPKAKENINNSGFISFVQQLN